MKDDDLLAMDAGFLKAQCSEAIVSHEDYYRAGFGDALEHRDDQGLAVYQGPDWPLYELDAVIAEQKAGRPFDATSLATLVRVHEALATAYNAHRENQSTPFEITLSEAKKLFGLPDVFHALNDDGHRLIGSREAVAHFTSLCGTPPAQPARPHITVQYDLSPAETESQLRAKLIEMGWTPPGQNKQAEPVYAYRRRGLNEFCTCDERRYKELSAKPSLFEVAVFYTHPAPAVAQQIAEIEKAIHYPECWDTALYPTIGDALTALESALKAIECRTCIIKGKLPAPAVAHHPTLKATGIHTERDGKMYQTCEVLSPTMPDSGTLLYTEAPAVAQSWELNEETAKFLADLILANDEPTPVTLSVGFIKDDDGKIQHGLRVHESEYPEEGGELLVESTPSPQKAPPAEVVRELVEAAQGALQFMEQGCTGCKVELDSDRYPCHTCNRAEKTAKDDLMQPRQELIDLRTALKSAKEHGL